MADTWINRVEAEAQDEPRRRSWWDACTDLCDVWRVYPYSVLCLFMCLMLTLHTYKVYEGLQSATREQVEAAPGRAAAFLEQIGVTPDKAIVCGWSPGYFPRLECVAAVQGQPVLLVCEQTCGLASR